MYPWQGLRMSSTLSLLSTSFAVLVLFNRRPELSEADNGSDIWTWKMIMGWVCQENSSLQNFPHMMATGQMQQIMTKDLLESNTLFIFGSQIRRRCVVAQHSNSIGDSSLGYIRMDSVCCRLRFAVSDRNCEDLLHAFSRNEDRQFVYNAFFCERGH